jgi:PilZ domain
MTYDNSRLMLENRKSPRRKMVLPVKISIDAGTHLAHTVDISHAGARLGALRTQMQPGTIVTVQRGAKKAQFRITWVRQLAPSEVRVGIEALEPQDNFWGVDLSDQVHTAKKDRAFLTLLLDCSKSRSEPKPLASERNEVQGRPGESRDGTHVQAENKSSNK